MEGASGQPATPPPPPTVEDPDLVPEYVGLTKMIALRLPEEMHSEIKERADEYGTSVNRLLVALIEQELSLNALTPELMPRIEASEKASRKLHSDRLKATNAKRRRLRCRSNQKSR